MYLSRIILNSRSHQARSELANVYELHRTVMRAFAGRATEADRVLFRMDIHPKTGIPTLLVQSSLEPDWSFLKEAGRDYLLTDADLPLEVDNPAIKSFDLTLRVGQTLGFRLRANPTKKVAREGHRQGQRVGLVHEKEQIAWLQRKIEAAGAVLLSAQVTNDGNAGGKLYRKDETHLLRFTSAQFDGVLQVTNPDLLAQTIGMGFGSGKGLGFGLLSLAPVRG